MGRCDWPTDVSRLFASTWNDFATDCTFWVLCLRLVFGRRTGSLSSFFFILKYIVETQCYVSFRCAAWWFHSCMLCCAHHKCSYHLSPYSAIVYIPSALPFIPMTYSPGPILPTPPFPFATASLFSVFICLLLLFCLFICFVS